MTDYEFGSDFKADGRITSRIQGVIMGTYTKMPLATKDLVGLSAQYVGLDGEAGYKRGSIYQCLEVSPGNYVWQENNPSGRGGGSNVKWEQIVKQGYKIAHVDIDEQSTEVLIPYAGLEEDGIVTGAHIQAIESIGLLSMAIEEEIVRATAKEDALQNLLGGKVDKRSEYELAKITMNEVVTDAPTFYALTSRGENNAFVYWNGETGALDYKEFPGGFHLKGSKTGDELNAMSPSELEIGDVYVCTQDSTTEPKKYKNNVYFWGSSGWNFLFTLSIDLSEYLKKKTSEANRVMISDESKNIVVSSLNSSKLNFLSDVTDKIQAQLNGKQYTLVSGSNIKTINGQSILGSGNISVTSKPTFSQITGDPMSNPQLATILNQKQATLVSGVNIKTVCGISILGEGNAVLTTNSEDSSTRPFSAKTTMEKIKTHVPKYRGEVPNAAALETITEKDINDWAIVRKDETHDELTSWYTWSGLAWAWMYSLNNMIFTREQLDAINSGITADLVSSYNNHLSNETIHTTYAEKNKLANIEEQATRNIITFNGVQNQNPEFYAPTTVGPKNTFFGSDGTTTGWTAIDNKVDVVAQNALHVSKIDNNGASIILSLKRNEDLRTIWTQNDNRIVIGAHRGGEIRAVVLDTTGVYLQRNEEIEEEVKSEQELIRREELNTRVPVVKTNGDYTSTVLNDGNVVDMVIKDGNAVKAEVGMTIDTLLIKKANPLGDKTVVGRFRDEDIFIAVNEPLSGCGILLNKSGAFLQHGNEMGGECLDNQRILREDDLYDIKSKQITSMAGYVIATSVWPIQTSDTLNQAIGKLEYRIKQLEDAKLVRYE